MSRMTIEKTVDTQGEEKWSVAEVEIQWIRLGEQFDLDHGVHCVDMCQDDASYGDDNDQAR